MSVLWQEKGGGQSWVRLIARSGMFCGFRSSGIVSGCSNGCMDRDQIRFRYVSLWSPGDGG